MKNIFCIIIAFFISIALIANGTKITITGDNITVKQAFEQIEAQSKYTIAYNQTQFDANRKLTVEIKNVIVKEALTLILKNMGASYKINGNHIIIKSNETLPKSDTEHKPEENIITPEVTLPKLETEHKPEVNVISPEVTSPNLDTEYRPEVNVISPEVTAAPNLDIEHKSEGNIVSPEVTVAPNLDTEHKSDENVVSPNATAPKSDTDYTLNQMALAGGGLSASADLTASVEGIAGVADADKLNNSPSINVDSTQTPQSESNITPTLSVDDTTASANIVTTQENKEATPKDSLNGFRERSFQLSFISPLGTNGSQSRNTINKVSINLLGGNSAGNTCFEFGGIYNINKKITKGFQIAGIFNSSDSAYYAVQFAGIYNVAKKGSVVMQMSGITNIAEDVNGAQFTGFVNTTKGLIGAQFAGIGNHSDSAVYAAQFAGLYNATKKGNIVMQMSAITNIAEDVNGAQFTGMVNVAKDVKGAQVAGLVNVAKKLKGVQIGLINVADTCEGGVPIGLINIVKKGGKWEFEVLFSESINTAVSFKLGVDRLYTIFSAGISYIGPSPIVYSAGLGLGTHFNWKKGWGNQIELISHVLFEGGNSFSTLSQLKFTVSKQFKKRFKIFAGPVLNMTITDHIDLNTGEFSNNISPWSMWNYQGNYVGLNAWIGFTAGIRF